jgi:hypothetical protein
MIYTNSKEKNSSKVKFLCSLILGLVLSLNSYGQTIGWARIHQIANLQGYGTICIDSNSNVYMDCGMTGYSKDHIAKGKPNNTWKIITPDSNEIFGKIFNLNLGCIDKNGNMYGNYVSKLNNKLKIGVFKLSGDSMIDLPDTNGFFDYSTGHFLCMLPDPDTPGNLYVGYTTDYYYNTSSVVKWNGIKWVSDTFFDGRLSKMAADKKGNIYYSGDFKYPNASWTNLFCIHKINQKTRKSKRLLLPETLVKNGLSYDIYDFILTKDSQICASGNYYDKYNTYNTYPLFSSKDSATWTKKGSFLLQFNNFITGMTLDDSNHIFGASNILYGGVSFGIGLRRVFKFNGSDWAALEGPNNDFFDPDAYINDVKVDKKGAVYVSGEFAKNFPSNGWTSYIGRFGPMVETYLSQTHFCSGDSINVRYQLYGDMPPGTKFTAELSDEYGDFVTPTKLGSAFRDTINGSFKVKLPKTLAKSNEYKIRVLAKCLQFDYEGKAADSNLTIEPPYEPIVTITASDSEICAGKLIKFAAIASNNDNSFNYNWRKNNQALNMNDSFYTDSLFSNQDRISCIIQTSALCAKQKIDTSNIIKLSVHPLPQAYYTINDTEQCANMQEIIISNNSIGSDTSILDLGDGNMKNLSIGTPISYTYLSSGIYQTLLKVKTTFGCRDSAYQNIYIHSAPSNTLSINGQNTVNHDKTESYSVLGGDSTSSFHWDVTGGLIQTKKDSGTVNILWGKTSPAQLKVSEINPNGCIGDTTILNVSILGNLYGIYTPEMMLYPIPFNEVLNVQSKDMVLVEVWDVQGRLLIQYQATRDMTQLNTSALAEGVYFVKIKLRNGNTYTHKVVKR